MKLSISEILAECAKFEKDEDQIAWLRKNDSSTLRLILKYWYDERIEFLLPNTPPPYTPLDHDNHGILYKKNKILPVFIKGGGYDSMSQFKREMKFISLLEQVHADDAKLLCRMLRKDPLFYLDRKVVQAAFPELFE